MSAVASMSALRAKLMAKKEAEAAAAKGTTAAPAVVKPPVIPTPAPVPQAKQAAAAPTAAKPSTKSTATAAASGPRTLAAAKKATTTAAAAPVTTAPTVAAPSPASSSAAEARAALKASRAVNPPTTTASASSSSSTHSSTPAPIKTAAGPRKLVKPGGSAAESDSKPSVAAATTKLASVTPAAPKAAANPSPVPLPSAPLPLVKPSDKTLKRKKPTSSGPAIIADPNAEDGFGKKARPNVSLADTSHLNKMGGFPRERNDGEHGARNAGTGDRPAYQAPRHESVLFVENVAPFATEQQVKAVFAIYGEVIHVQIIPPKPVTTFSNDGGSTMSDIVSVSSSETSSYSVTTPGACASVKFQSKDAAAIAQEMLNDSLFLNRIIMVRFLEPKYTPAGYAAIVASKYHLLQSEENHLFLQTLHAYKPYLFGSASADNEGSIPAKPFTTLSDCFAMKSFKKLPNGATGDDSLSATMMDVDPAIIAQVTADAQIPQRQLIHYDYFTYEDD